MNNKNFIQGFLYGIAFAESLVTQYKNVWVNPSGQVIVWFTDGSHLIFAINRGISHIYGNNVAMLTQKESCNLFDIAYNWVTEAQEKAIISLGYNFEHGEIRVTFDELITIIDALGEIDYSTTQKEWLAIYHKKYEPNRRTL